MKNWALIRSILCTAIVVLLLNLPDKKTDGVSDHKQGYHPSPVLPLEHGGNLPVGDKKQPRNFVVLGSEKWAQNRD
jgi:hypothetical protein